MNKFNIDQKVVVMHRTTKTAPCECCDQLTTVTQKAKATTGHITEISIRRNGIYYGVRGLNKSYKDTVYLYEEKDLKEA